MTTFAKKLETIFGKGCRIIRRAEFLEEIRYSNLIAMNFVQRGDIKLNFDDNSYKHSSMYVWYMYYA